MQPPGLDSATLYSSDASVPSSTPGSRLPRASSGGLGSSTSSIHSAGGKRKFSSPTPALDGHAGGGSGLAAAATAAALREQQRAAAAALTVMPPLSLDPQHTNMELYPAMPRHPGRQQQQQQQQQHGGYAGHHRTAADLDGPTHSLLAHTQEADIERPLSMTSLPRVGWSMQAASMATGAAGLLDGALPRDLGASPAAARSSAWAGQVLAGPELDARFSVLSTLDGDGGRGGFTTQRHQQQHSSQQRQQQQHSSQQRALQGPQAVAQKLQEQAGLTLGGGGGDAGRAGARQQSMPALQGQFSFSGGAATAAAAGGGGGGLGLADGLSRSGASDTLGAAVHSGLDVRATSSSARSLFKLCETRAYHDEIDLLLGDLEALPPPGASASAHASPHGGSRGGGATLASPFPGHAGPPCRADSDHDQPHMGGPSKVVRRESDGAVWRYFSSPLPAVQGLEDGGGGAAAGAGPGSYSQHAHHQNHHNQHLVHHQRHNYDHSHSHDQARTSLAAPSAMGGGGTSLGGSRGFGWMLGSSSVDGSTSAPLPTSSALAQQEQQQEQGLPAHAGSLLAMAAAQQQRHAQQQQHRRRLSSGARGASALQEALQLQPHLVVAGSPPEYSHAPGFQQQQQTAAFRANSQSNLPSPQHPPSDAPLSLAGPSGRAHAAGADAVGTPSSESQRAAWEQQQQLQQLLAVQQGRERGQVNHQPHRDVQEQLRQLQQLQQHQQEHWGKHSDEYTLQPRQQQQHSHGHTHRHRHAHQQPFRPAAPPVMLDVLDPHVELGTEVYGSLDEQFDAADELMRDILLETRRDRAGCGGGGGAGAGGGGGGGGGGAWLNHNSADGAAGGGGGDLAAAAILTASGAAVALQAWRPPRAPRGSGGTAAAAAAVLAAPGPLDGPDPAAAAFTTAAAVAGAGGAMPAWGGLVGASMALGDALAAAAAAAAAGGAGGGAAHASGRGSSSNLPCPGAGQLGCGAAHAASPFAPAALDVRPGSGGPCPSPGATGSSGWGGSCVGAEGPHSGSLGNVQEAREAALVDEGSRGSLLPAGGSESRLEAEARAVRHGSASQSARQSARSAGKEVKSRTYNRTVPTFGDIVSHGLFKAGPTRWTVGTIKEEVEVDVLESGGIVYGGATYPSISAFALVVLRSRNSDRLACDGWREVRFKGFKMEVLRKECLRMMLEAGEV